MSSSTSLAERSRRSRIARSRSRASSTGYNRSTIASADNSTIPVTGSVNGSLPPKVHRSMSTPPPALVTPTHADQVYRRDSSVPPEVVLSRRTSDRDHKNIPRRVPESIDYETGTSNIPEASMDEEMPMDEMIHVLKKRTTESPALSSLPENDVLIKDMEHLDLGFTGHDTNQKFVFSKSKVILDAADRGGGGRSTMVDDDMSSLGIEESSLARMTLALKSRSGRRPDDLTNDEKALWDVVQSNLINQTSEQLQKRRILEHQVHATSTQLADIRDHNQNLQKKLEVSCVEVNTLKKQLQVASEYQGKQSDRQQFGESKKVTKLECRLAEMEAKYKGVKEKLDQQQDEHDSAVRAIQRVMADVAYQKEVEVESFKNQLETMKEELNTFEKTRQSSLAKDLTTQQGAPVDIAALRARAQRAFQLEREMDGMKSLLETIEGECDVLQVELGQKSGQLVVLAKELNNLKDVMSITRAHNLELEAAVVEQNVEIHTLKGELSHPSSALDRLAEREKILTIENAAKDRQIVKLKQHLRCGSTDEADDVSINAIPSKSSKDHNVDLVASIRKQLEEKEKSLETSKLLIASLQDANGSMAVDLRAKLKEKEEHVHLLEAETYERKRTCDSLAVDLRDLQTLQDEMHQFEEKAKKESMRQKVLAKQLESTVAELQAASAVYEATTSCNPGSHNDLDQITDILCQTLMSLKMNLSAMEVGKSTIDYKSISACDFETDIQSVSSIGGVDPQELNKHLDAIIRNDREAASKDLRNQLEAKSVAVQKLEELLRKEREEAAIMKKHYTRLEMAQKDTETKFNAEILSLKCECKANMEVLTMKERELEDLRDSFEVNDGVGYISDESDDDDDNDGINQLRSAASLEYGMVQAEALATLLAHGGSGLEADSNEVQRLHSELVKAQKVNERASKDLSIEQESLANAKMIISSLEKANKCMLEDLRSRLQESNTAIASLLDKSSENEKSSASLKAELERVKRDKEKAKADYEALSKKMKDDALAAAMRTAAKDRELAQLRLTVGSTVLPSNKRFPAEP